MVSIAGHGVRVYIVAAKEGTQRRQLQSTITEMVDQSLTLNLLGSCRGVGAQRLPVILATGCDVEPSDAPLFVSSLEKALEYGQQEDQVIQVFKHDHLEISWRERSAALSSEERAEIEKDYPNVIPSIDGSSLWFTRFSPEDNRAATDYEREYGHWIPGSAVEALAALVLISSNPNRYSEHLRKIGVSSGQTAQIDC